LQFEEEIQYIWHFTIIYLASHCRDFDNI